MALDDDAMIARVCEVIDAYSRQDFDTRWQRGCSTRMG
jgi:hypothetical protein